jgi:hypothetical protein
VDLVEQEAGGQARASSYKKTLSAAEVDDGAGNVPSMRAGEDLG